MIRPVAGSVMVALVSLSTVEFSMAQQARDVPGAEPRARVQAARLAHIPVSKRTHVRQSPSGPETVEDRVLYTVVPYNWQGLYVGLHGGGAWGQTRSGNNSPFGGYDAGTPIGYALSPSGVIAGGQLGFLIQSANWVYGVEFDVGHLGLDSRRTIGDDLTAVKYGWYGTFTGRLGFAWDHALYYVKGGATLARIRNSAGDLDGGTIDPTDFSEISGARWGWTIGGGLEYAFAPNMSAKVEYLYMDFGSVTSVNTDGDSFRHSNAVHSVKLGVNYRFGGVPLDIRF